MRWVDGVPLSRLLEEGDPDVAGAGCSAGAALAAIGRHRFAQPGFLGPNLSIETAYAMGPQAYVEFVEHALFDGAGAKWLGPALAARLIEFVRANAAYLTAVQGESVLVHGDFNPENILVERRGERWATAAVLDWEFSFSGTPLVDVGNMLRYAAEMPGEFEQEFVRGYLDGGGRLPREWKRISKLVDLLSLCQFLRPPDQREAVVRDMWRLIQAMLDSWDSLAA